MVSFWRTLRWAGRRNEHAWLPRASITILYASMMGYIFRREKAFEEYCRAERAKIKMEREELERLGDKAKGRIEDSAHSQESGKKVV